MSDYPRQVKIGNYFFQLDKYDHWVKSQIGSYQRGIAPTWAEIDMVEEIIELRREVQYLRCGAKF